MIASYSHSNHGRQKINTGFSVRLTKSKFRNTPRPQINYDLSQTFMALSRSFFPNFRTVTSLRTIIRLNYMGLCVKKTRYFCWYWQQSYFLYWSSCTMPDQAHNSDHPSVNWMLGPGQLKYRSLWSYLTGI